MSHSISREELVSALASGRRLAILEALGLAYDEARLRDKVAS